MFLKSLEIFGFKSFADRTRIEFSDGITALLGPNGCGKSNVVDAIKWVLGEQATKSLRAEAMEDVIFNGTEVRKALNVAEVSLTFANDNGILPLDVPEITIRRRLFRNGESEYYVNSAPVKLKELKEIFYDTGVGKSAYSIMEQGKIDQVLSHKPEERRHLFEEAASITKYKMRGQEAERKLEKTDENMRQVEGILGEVKRSYDSLKKQAEKTETYRRLKDEGFELDLTLQLIRLREALESKDKRRKDLDSYQSQRDELKKFIDGINEHLETNLDEVNTMEAGLIEAQKNLYGIELEKNNHDNQIKLLTERIAEIEQKIEGDKARETTVKKKQESLNLETEAARTSLAGLAGRMTEIENNISQFAQSIENSQKRMQNNADENQGLEASILEWDNQALAADNELRDLTDRIVSQLDRSLGESGYSSQARRNAESELRRRLDALVVSVRGRMDFAGDLERMKDAELRSQGLASMRRGLEDILSGVQDLKSGMDTLHDSLPHFLDEFLAPEGTLTRKRDLDARVAAIRTNIAAARHRMTELSGENSALAKKIDEYRDTLEELRLGKERVIGQRRAVEEQIERSLDQIRELEAQIGEIRKVLAEDHGRIQGLKQKIAEITEAKTGLGKQEKELRKKLAELEKGISSRNKELIHKEKQLKSQMGQLAAIQDKIERTQIDLADAQAEMRNIYGNFRERYSRDLSEYESRMFEIADSAKDLREKAGVNREELRNLGSVNLMAPEEFAEIKERYDFLSGQIEDLRRAKEDLIQVTAEIRNESAQLFIETYEKIKRNFHMMFRRLFGGGRAELKLSEPENVLESGIEIFAQPPGKRLENIALLSGGERSLTAVALLFATYMVKPSPFCLLDEIDAALDESNVGRFVTMLMEFGASSQFIIITHNKKTVTGARTLLGVTMEESGVSKIIAIRLSNEAPVDPDLPEDASRTDAGSAASMDDGPNGDAVLAAEIAESES